MGSPAPAPRLVGRDAEIQALGEALDRVGSGQPVIALVEGEAGIGKTRLLEEALQAACERGMQVVSGRAAELEQTRPFGVLADAFECARASADPRRAALPRRRPRAGRLRRAPACSPGPRPNPRSRQSPSGTYTREAGPSRRPWRPIPGSARRFRRSSGDSSPSLQGSKARWFKMCLATWIASTHSLRSVSVTGS